MSQFTNELIELRAAGTSKGSITHDRVLNTDGVEQLRIMHGYELGQMYLFPTKKVHVSPHDDYIHLSRELLIHLVGMSDVTVEEVAQEKMLRLLSK